MFRVKIQVPKELVTRYIERIKTGVRGVGYVKVKDSAAWPARLDKNLVTPAERDQRATANLRWRHPLADRSAAPCAAPVVSIEEVTHRYGKVVALDDISLEIPSGLMVGIIGPDGVGKSTLLALMAGSQQVQEGKVTVLDGDIADGPAPARGRARGSPTCRRAWARTSTSSSASATTSTSWRSCSGCRPSERRVRVTELLEATGLGPFPIGPPASSPAA